MKKYRLIKYTAVMVSIAFLGCSCASKKVLIKEDSGAIINESQPKEKPAKQDPTVSDPIMGYNRVMNKVNDKLFSWVLCPTARGYKRVMPEQGRVAVGRFFTNIAFPSRLANNLLQAKFKKAGTECMRFGMNTSVGVLGFMDPATEWMNLLPSDEDFGQTLGYYGIGAGPHIVLPLLGHTNLRDAVANLPDSMLDPLSVIDSSGASMAIETLQGVNDISFMADEYDEIKKSVSDFYTYQRNSYENGRKLQIAQ